MVLVGTRGTVCKSRRKGHPNERGSTMTTGNRTRSYIMHRKLRLKEWIRRQARSRPTSRTLSFSRSCIPGFRASDAADYMYIYSVYRATAYHWLSPRPTHSSSISPSTWSSSLVVWPLPLPNVSKCAVLVPLVFGCSDCCDIK